MTVVDEYEWWEWRAPGAHAVFTSAEVGNVGLHVGDDPARVHAARARAAALVGLDPSHVAGVTQVHGADVWLDLAGRAETGFGADVRWDAGPSPVEADALVTAQTGVAVAVGVADCLPIAIAWGDAVAAVHAGWRSLAGEVIEATLTVLRRAAGTSAALAGAGPRAVIGPALCSACFEVGEEVAARFAPPAIQRRPEWARPHLDARGDATFRLEAAGCEVEQVDVCTACDPRLSSHRRDAATAGRQAVLVRRT